MSSEKIIFTNQNGASVQFDINSNYHVNIEKDVEGLADMDNEIYSIQSMGQAGSTYVGQRQIERTITIAGTYNKKNASDIIVLRKALSKILNAEKGTLKYLFTDAAGTTEKVIDCIPRKKLLDLKSQAIFKDFAITFECPDPYWKDPFPTIEEIATWEDSFEFELEIPEDTGIEMGYRTPSLIKNITNDGDAVIGAEFTFTAFGTISNPQIINIERAEFIKINTTMISGDKITVTTGFDEKDVILTRNGETQSYYDYWNIENTYLQLYPGDNIFTYTSETGEENLEISIKKIIKYGSV